MGEEAAAMKRDEALNGFSSNVDGELSLNGF